MVMDNRELDRVTVRKYVLVPNSEGIKSTRTVAGRRYIRVGDLKEGFNQCDNEPEAAAKMDVLVASGSYLPTGLTFGPANGPEDFQELDSSFFLVVSIRSGSCFSTTCQSLLAGLPLTRQGRLALTMSATSSPRRR